MIMRSRRLSDGESFSSSGKNSHLVGEMEYSEAAAAAVFGLFLHPFALLSILRNHPIAALPPLATYRATCERGVGGGRRGE